MKREGLIKQMAEEKRPWDLLIIGGGATGLGVAVDASSRGYRVLLVEQHDFAKATSSRSTKLVHGGVRYLQQGAFLSKTTRDLSESAGKRSMPNICLWDYL